MNQFTPQEEYQLLFLRIDDIGRLLDDLHDAVVHQSATAKYIVVRIQDEHKALIKDWWRLIAVDIENDMVLFHNISDLTREIRYNNFTISLALTGE